jgi:YfaZ precursor
MPTLTRSIMALPLLLACGAAAAQEADANRPQGEVTLSDDTMQLRYIDNGKNVDLDRGARASGTFFLSEARDIVLSADVLIPAELDWDRLQMYFGPRAYAALLEDENNDVLSLTLGAEIRYVLDRNSGLAVSGQAFYGPDILTFGTADNLTDLSARVEIRPQERLTVFAGMRWFEFELTEDEPNRTLQEELFAGVGWRF